MLPFVLKRFVSLALTLLAASLVIFIVTNVVPGDPAQYMLGLDAEPSAIAALHRQMGLDQPAVLRYFHWLGGLLVGHFGTSYTYKVPVADLISARLLVSLPLALYALVLSTLIAFPAGIVSAAQAQFSRRRLDHGRHPARHRRAELLVRDAAGPSVFDHAALVFLRRFPRLERRLPCPP